ncbi:MAG: hypothetical protein ABSH20_05495 [Tepidisphaeraceae bacterium]|jgi:protein ImuA
MAISLVPSSDLTRLRELQAILENTAPKSRREGFRAKLPDWDTLLPNHTWPRAAIHEFLVPATDGRITDDIMTDRNVCPTGIGAMTDRNVCPTNMPLTPAAILAFRARQTGFIAWIDPDRQIYPPALAALGIPLNCVLWIHPTKPRDLVWAIAECLRCPGVDVTIASPPALSRIEARRLQLAAETGGGIGLLLRPHNPGAIYAAATRWLITPVPATRDGRRWNIQLLHGHGGLTGQSIILELDHETYSLRTFVPVADRPAQATHDVALRSA